MTSLDDRFRSLNVSSNSTGSSNPPHHSAATPSKRNPHSHSNGTQSQTYPAAASSSSSSSPSSMASSPTPSTTYTTNLNMDQVKLLFGSIDILSVGYISRYQFEETLLENGISLQDGRLEEVRRRLNESSQLPTHRKSSIVTLTNASNIPSLTSTSSPLAEPNNTATTPSSTPPNLIIDSTDRIDLNRFAYIIEPNAEFIERIIRRQLVIPDWQSFVKTLTELYMKTKDINEGDVADYIPELALADPNWFGVSFCSVDGQQFSIGDTNREYSVQSSSKPISYLMALEELGEDEVHRYVGREPSGRNFNEMCLNPESIPHNPMVNSGAIMVTSLIKHGEDQSSRFRHIMDVWNSISGSQKYITFSNSTYLSERATADRNFCLGYMMQEHHSFDLGSIKMRHLPGREWDSNDLVKNLELYFQCCSIQTSCDGQSVIASTLASGGRCPTTHREIFSPNHVRDCLALMLSCGMYDYSGEWAYKIGLPAKSGVSGCLMVVIPNVGGLAIYSPPLDRLGNSVRGIRFCSELIQRCSFHYYDRVNGIVCSSSLKINPSADKNSAYQNDLLTLCTLCAKGDLTGIRAILSNGADPNGCDYDGRSPLHLAASEGQLSVIKYLLTVKNIDLNPIDRWGGTPFSDAVREGHQQVAEYLFQKLKAQGITPSTTPIQQQQRQQQSPTIHSMATST